MTGTLSTSAIWHQTIYVAPEVNEILCLANLVLSTFNLFPRVTHISSALTIVSFTACTSAALTKLCIAPESIKTVLHYTYYTIMGNSKSCNFFERFLPNVQAP